MKMSEKEFHNEYLYTSTMVQVRKMLDMGMIDEEDYSRIETKMRSKYQPVSDGLIIEAMREYRPANGIPRGDDEGCQN